MSTDDHTDSIDCTDDSPDQPPKGTDLQTDLVRVGRLVAAAIGQGHDHNDQFAETTHSRVDDLASWFDNQNLSAAEAVATAWFFLLKAADE